MIGSTFSSRYEILDSLGSGGMGVVWLAEDKHTGRKVALKLLAPELTLDPGAKARFLQEAQAASSLDHPNICTVFDVGETEDSQVYLAMPCYEGETLKARIARGPLPVAGALEIALQVAQGLAEAHRQGIVHCDIKPANLMIAPERTVRILDFGVARLSGPAGSRTDSHPAGAVGTPAYMAPEQVRGEEVDPRTDLWALGVVLYEMLAGRRPFTGERDLIVLHAVLTARPAPLSRFCPEAPPELERIVARLLAREPEGRYPDAESLIADLRRLTGPATGAIELQSWLPRGRAVRRAAGLILAVLGLLLGIYLAFWSRPPSVGDAPRPVRLTEGPGIESFPSFSPQGDHFVYSRLLKGAADVYLQPAAPGKAAINLTPSSPGRDTQPAWSPDGKWIAFHSDRDGGGIFLMKPDGKDLRRLTSFGFNPAWSPDSREILVSTQPADDPRGRISRSRIWRVDVATQERRILVERDGMQPSWSPSGERIAYWSFVPGSPERILWTIPAEGGDPEEVARDGSINWSPVWSPDGRWLYFASDRSGSMKIWRVSVDERTGRVQGQPKAIATPSGWNGPLSISRDGSKILYATRATERSLDRIALDPESLHALGRPRPVLGAVLPIGFGKASPDGKWIVFNTESPREDLYLVHPDGSNLRRLTDDEALDRGPGWLPDGRILFFSNRGGGRFGAWAIRRDGSGLEEIAASHGDPIYNPLASPVGRWLACAGFQGAGLIDLSKPLEERVPENLPPALLGETFYPGSWSPDGQQLLGEVPGYGIFVFSLASRRFWKLADRGTLPVWTSGGRRIAFIVMDEGKIFAVDVPAGTPGRKRPRELYAAPELSTLGAYDVSPDGRTLYVIQTPAKGDIWMVKLEGF